MDVHVYILDSDQCYIYGCARALIIVDTAEKRERERCQFGCSLVLILVRAWWLCGRPMHERRSRLLFIISSWTRPLSGYQQCLQLIVDRWTVAVLASKPPGFSWTLTCSRSRPWRDFQTMEDEVFAECIWACTQPLISIVESADLGNQIDEVITHESRYRGEENLEH
jgi:hypothetical protein